MHLVTVLSSLGESAIERLRPWHVILAPPPPGDIPIPTDPNLLQVVVQLYSYYKAKCTGQHDVIRTIVVLYKMRTLIKIVLKILHSWLKIMKWTVKWTVRNKVLIVKSMNYQVRVWPAAIHNCSQSKLLKKLVNLLLFVCIF